MTDPRGWRYAKVVAVRHDTPHSVTLRMDVPDRVRHLPGQHYVIRLTAEDGYRAQRSYSVASAPADPLLELFVERLEDGEVSTYLADIVEPGDELEIRGPIGGWFAWDGATPALGVGGGSGVVPMISMLRHNSDNCRVAVSVRTAEDLPYANELTAAGALIAVTREDFGGRAGGRLTARELLPLYTPGAICYVCGSAAFAEAASMLLLDIGVPTADIRVERFGPSG
ncbi:FAD-binding oxidoreductase [Kutzneria kofuensis]|uniref:Ferredoxin-NADP reductase n=1 Tax=Kutzneria kofuensis TaxID=103725 RepID=A0A7W9NE31_9PSEU|nr:FAD-binding oxidoreductase [Kutzneria kofuensis]MBB5889280.1 ferredoxin-NADP reductase [Kutzneria kofuensis]